MCRSIFLIWGVRVEGFFFVGGRDGEAHTFASLHRKKERTRNLNRSNSV